MQTYQAYHIVRTLESDKPRPLLVDVHFHPITNRKAVFLAESNDQAFTMACERFPKMKHSLAVGVKK